MAIYVITNVVISKSQLEHSRIWNCDLCRWIVLGKTVCISNDCVIGSSEAWKYLHVNMNFIYKAFIYAIDFDCIENELWSVLHWGVREFFANLIYKFDSFAHAKCEESFVEPKKQEINMNNWHESVNLACDWTDQRWNVRHIPYENRKPTAKSPKNWNYDRRKRIRKTESAKWKYHICKWNRSDVNKWQALKKYFDLYELKCMRNGKRFNERKKNKINKHTK